MNPNTLLRNAVLAAAILLSVAAAGGQPVDPPPSRVVSYADLNLNTSAGVRALYRRIEHMADRVCELPRETRQLKNWTDLAACKAGATERAVRLVNLPALDDLHVARSGRRLAPAQVTSTR